MRGEFYAGHPIDATNAVILLEDTIKRFDPVISCKQHDLECFHLNKEEQKKALRIYRAEVKDGGTRKDG